MNIYHGFQSPRRYGSQDMRCSKRRTDCASEVSSQQNLAVVSASKVDLDRETDLRAIDPGAPDAFERSWVGYSINVDLLTNMYDLAYLPFTGKAAPAHPFDRFSTQLAKAT
jgi:hypothetical protein